MSEPKSLESVIDGWLARDGRSKNPRPDFSDRTVRRLYASELAREIRKYAKVVRR